jgi:lipopolysaccharide/colanic/teichoic acid biosynthesis glycosyltransferase/glycosyltransferase involved in cell wall biosynthesis
MKVALVHDWLTGMRGGERVLQELCGLFPDASIFTLFHEPGSVSPLIEAMPIHTSFLNCFPGARRHYRHLLPLFPWAISRFDLRAFDLVLSVSHAVAKGIRTPSGSLHICYCLTPMRFIWDMQADYFHYADRLGINRTALRVMKQPLRLWDRATACRVDHFIADSRHVQGRITRCYDRPSKLIYPPVDTEFFSPASGADRAGYYLLVSALVPYKRVDLAIEAFNRLRQPLVIVGSGPDFDRLKRKAAGNVRFRGSVTNEDLRTLYRRCRAVIVTAREDFGLVALEAQACGSPPLAYAGGGSLESIVDGETGILFGKQTAASLIEAICRFEQMRLDPERLRASAERFSREAFRRSILQFVDEEWQSHTAGSAPVAAGPGAATGLPAGDSDRIHASLMGLRGIAKRTLDVSLSLCGLLMFGLPLLLLALIIRRGSDGPGFFFQTRIGLKGRRFVMIKLRTMHVGAERERGPTLAVSDDPRCTRLGGFLRRYGIDELPQLWNVLIGEMSLVGPRPERQEFQRIFEERLPEFRRRLEVRGGISGLAQIRGWRGDTSIEKRLQSDLEYIERWSFWKDLAILFLTPPSLLRPKLRRGITPRLARGIAPVDS